MCSPAGYFAKGSLEDGRGFHPAAASVSDTGEVQKFFDTSDARRASSALEPHRRRNAADAERDQADHE
jgi:hypothetical protein